MKIDEDERFFMTDKIRKMKLNNRTTHNTNKWLFCDSLQKVATHNR